MTHENEPTYSELQRKQDKAFISLDIPGLPVEDFQTGEPAVQRISGVSYADEIRSNAPVSLNLDSIEQRFDMLGDAIRKLHVAIDPILGPAEDSGEKYDGVLLNASPLVQRLHEIDESIRRMTINVDALVARVEV